LNFAIQRLRARQIAERNGGVITERQHHIARTNGRSSLQRGGGVRTVPFDENRIVRIEVGDDILGSTRRLFEKHECVIARATGHDLGTGKPDAPNTVTDPVPLLTVAVACASCPSVRGTLPATSVFALVGPEIRRLACMVGKFWTDVLLYEYIALNLGART
jgi:hypothetical protein